MTGSEFNSLSGSGGGGAHSVPTGLVVDNSDWDTTSTGLEGPFQDGGGGGVGYSNHPHPFLTAAYTPFLTENSAANAAARGFETQPQQQRFSTQMLSYNTTAAGKFVSKPAPPPPPPSLSSASGFQLSQAQGNEYWTSMSAITTTTGGDQIINNWKMDYNNSNNGLSDFGRQCTYDEFIPLPLQTGVGRPSSFGLGEDGQSPETLHFSPNDEGQGGYGEKIWGDALKCHGQNLPSHHGLPYTFFDDSSTANIPSAGAFPPWTDTPGLDTIAPKALTLSSSSISFSGSSSSDCGSLDSVSTHDGPFHSTTEIQSIQEVLKQEANQEVTVRHKLPTRPLRQYVTIAPSLERTRQVVSTRATTSKETKASRPSPAPPLNPPAPTPHPQTRSTKDAFLITSKRAGMSYRAIRQAGNFSEAESTLRGRYRTLTKQKEERVRKPEWTEGDVRLLREGVERFSCGKGRGRGRGKTPWKRVAEFIEGNGGSYRFGNATCRKMWDRLGGEEEGYVDTSLVGSSHLDKAAITNASGEAIWAITPGSNKPSCRRLPQPFEAARQQTRRALREFTSPASDSMFPRPMDVFMDEK
ncbi:hypothetical protein VE01_02091 [Pseudogymnoascus verrucosus]|uniref:Myb-like domain-containing protein n=1 Tax=Pseudogymnoascus verrucosus TaxID=342668 RepID=A0A1B8GUW9_9PEZI|nr:uncharacterized protein VE01_02091 [Pseudogymnoascus verrucosus]OBT99644.1 hypothetical protein VE01_02091 [Pseudogymnoascus verrucosus]